MLFDIHTPDRVGIGTIEAYSSMQWIRRYHTAGEFELHIPVTRETSKLLQRENLIVKGDEAGIIESIRYTFDGKTQGEVIQVNGHLLAGYCARRILWGTVSHYDNEEDVMVALAVPAIAQGARAVQGLTVAPSGGWGVVVSYQSDNENLLDALAGLSEASGIGFRVDFNEAGLTFRTYKGMDRSAGQSINPRAIFSREFENILSQEYGEDARKHANVALVTHTKQEETITTTVGTATGRARYELAVRAGQVDRDKDGNDIPPAQQLILMAEQGRETLKSLEVVRALEARADPAGNLVYKQHYDLGDIVTVDAPSWGVAMDVRITEIKEIYEAGGCSLELTFGKGNMTFKDIVRWYSNG